MYFLACEFVNRRRYYLALLSCVTNSSSNKKLCAMKTSFGKTEGVKLSIDSSSHLLIMLFVKHVRLKDILSQNTNSNNLSQIGISVKTIPGPWRLPKLKENIGVWSVSRFSPIGIIWTTITKFTQEKHLILARNVTRASKKSAF